MASEWTSAELSEEAFDDLDEAAQRKLDSWAFGIYEQAPTQVMRNPTRVYHSSSLDSGSLHAPLT